MRLLSRNSTSAEVALPKRNSHAFMVESLGSTRIPLKAEQLLGATMRVNRVPDVKSSNPRDPYASGGNDEDRALESLAHMQRTVGAREQSTSAVRASNWIPWSPDDLFPQDELSSSQLQSNDASSDALYRSPRRLPELNLPPAYCPSVDDSYMNGHAQHIPPAAASGHDKAIIRGNPPSTIDQSYSTTPLPQIETHLTPSPDTSATEGAERGRPTALSKPGKLDLVHLFPQPRSSPSGRLLSPSRLQHSASAMSEKAGHSAASTQTKPRSKLTKSPTSVTPASVKPMQRDNDDIFGEHKTNVRRPPKGIQNWFDAYLDSDDDDEDYDDAQYADVDEAEPQELPADDVLPPAYTAPNRVLSRLSEKSSREQPDHVHPWTIERREITTDQGLHRPTSFSSDASNSIQSSHQGHISRGTNGDNRMVSSAMGEESVLSLSESDHDGTTEEEQLKGLPPIRDSIMFAQHITVGNAASIDVMRHQKPITLSNARRPSRDDNKASTEQLSISMPSPQNQHHDKLSTVPPAQQYSNTAFDQGAMHRHVRSSLSTGTYISESPSPGVTGDAAGHLMEVTEEERMLLDLIRQKRTMMQQTSFTEGYQMALQAEQQRLTRRTASAERRALKALNRKQSQSHGESTSSSNAAHHGEADMRRQLSAIRKEQVDERFQIERFLEMQQPQPLSSHPPNDDEMPTELPHGHESVNGEILPATRYSPPPTAGSSTFAEMNPGYFSADECETASARVRVKHFIDTNGAVPPLNSMKTMHRPSHRQEPSMPPSPIEEEHIAPPVPRRSVYRPTPPLTGSQQSLENKVALRKVASVSVLDSPRSYSPTFVSPISAYTAPTGFRRKPSKEQDFTSENSNKTAYVPSRPRTSSKPDLYTKAVSSAATTAASSPFSNIITAATAKPSVHRVDSSQSHFERDTRRAVNRFPPPPRLDSLEDVRLRRNSMQSMTSASEEVMDAWAELGGGSLAYYERSAGRCQS